LVDATHGIPLDYKCWVFHGRVEFIQIDFNRYSNHSRTIVDRQWRRQAWGHNPLYPPGPNVERPARLDQMIEIAERLAVDPDFVRVDLYCIDGVRILFGELTFAPGAGWTSFWPDRRVDVRVGSLW